MSGPSIQPMILVVDDEKGVQSPVPAALQRAGYQVSLARDSGAALTQAAQAAPDLILAPVSSSGIDGFELLRLLRAEPSTAAIPVILLAAPDAEAEVVTGLRLGADDCLTQPVDITELLLRVRARIDRPLSPRELLRHDPKTGLLRAHSFDEEMERELVRGRGPGSRGASGGCLAYLELDEPAPRRVPPGARAQEEIARQVAMLLLADAGPLEIAGREADGRFALLLPLQSARAARRRLEQLSRRIAAHGFTAGGEPVRLTPMIGHAPLRPGASGEELRRQALAALAAACGPLNRHPVEDSPAAARGKLFAPDRGGFWAALYKAARTPVKLWPTPLASRPLWDRLRREGTRDPHGILTTAPYTDSGATYQRFRWAAKQ